MSKNRKFVRVFQNFYQQFKRKPPSTVKEQSLWLLRSFIVTKKRPDWVNAGFVLPTVAMVSLVVVLLTIAILFRSFERSKNASNVRVNQVVLNAAMPAIDRARAKIDKLFDDPSLPRSTPSDNALYNAFTKDLGKYTFGDETPLEVRYDIDGRNIDREDKESLEERETIKTAWRFPVDTDNNGKYDSFTLYGVYFRSPTRGEDGKFNRPRSPLDARTPPMDDGSLGGLCAAARGTSFSLIGDSGWYKSGANIKKSFFVYATTVPIDDKQITSERLNKSDYEAYRGNRGFSAVEFQQDQERVPINNNAVVYEDDLEIAPGSGLEINGRIFTNSNFITVKTWKDSPIKFYQVSNQNSCFYQAENSKIIVGGNVSHGRINGLNGSNQSVIVDLYKPDAKAGQAEITNSTTKNSTTGTSGDVAYNSQAYTQRINALVEAALKKTDPTEVEESINSRLKENPGLDPTDVRREELAVYFKKRTRKVPFKEVRFGGNATSGFSLGGNGDTLKGPDKWINPFNITSNNPTYSGFSLNLDKLAAADPERLTEEYRGEEKYLGDRVLVGNNLPALWFDKNKNEFFGKKTPQKFGEEWEKIEVTDGKQEERYRTTRVEDLLSLEGASDRDGFFEIKATQKPKNSLDNVGGMRVVTGAGIYVDGPDSDSSASFPWDEDMDKTTVGIQPRSFLANSRPGWDTNFVGTGSDKVPESKLRFDGKTPIPVWSDAMPMTGGGDLADNLKVKGDLLMRATAVYHYRDNDGTDQTPIACVSSYYDPTNTITAQNESTLKKYWKNSFANQATTQGKSNNGIVYKAPYSSDSARLSAIGTYKKQLEQQARLVFPNGRFVNEPLRKALEKRKSGKNLSMADNSAIDTAVCAIRILKGSLSPDSSKIPHGTIYETTFLDAREIKSVEKDANVAKSTVDPDYTRSIEERQPLEVRVTVLDLDKLRKEKIGASSPTQEYLLPNSGIIYATRDDALRDLSNSLNPDDADESKLLSPSDYKLDPTRRPNGIMLINGENLEREKKFRYEEKGLILASNVPAYIKGNLNFHYKSGTTTTVEEFTFKLQDKDGNINWKDFYSTSRKALDDNFACRKGNPRLPSDKCGTGDSWRPATVLADAVTVLSDNFRFGFRNEGDYDLRNNQGDFKSADYQKQGFFDNNYLTSSEWFDKSGSNKGFPKDFDTSTPKPGQPKIQGSSYLNNFVTPIQRRVEFGEYLMEVCTKIPVSSCQAADWSIDGAGMKKTKPIIGQKYQIATHKAGTTVDLADSTLQRYARRVAFARKSTGELILDEYGHPVPLGIDSSGNIQAYAKRTVPAANNDGLSFETGKLPRTKDNALWFRTTNSLPNKKLPTNTDYGYGYPLFYQTADGKNLTGTDANEQPLLVPVLQIHMPNKATKSADDPPKEYDELPGNYDDRGYAADKNWFQTASPTTTNLTIAGGDTPARSTETNGGLENFIRYLEKWQEDYGKDKDGVSHSLSGSIIQYKRSAYATAPWQVVQAIVSGKSSTSKGTSIFGSDYELFYASHVNRTNKKSMTPFYTPPSRQWGFDVGLLSQLPDLFALTFTMSPTNKPNDFFREVNRDDKWVKTLLCAKTLNVNKTSGNITPTNKNAVSESQRPQDFCK